MMEGLFQNIERTEIGTASKALSVYLLSLHPPRHGSSLFSG